MEFPESSTSSFGRSMGSPGGSLVCFSMLFLVFSIDGSAFMLGCAYALLKIIDPQRKNTKSLEDDDWGSVKKK